MDQEKNGKEKEMETSAYNHKRDPPEEKCGLDGSNSIRVRSREDERSLAVTGSLTFSSVRSGFKQAIAQLYKVWLHSEVQCQCD